MSDDIVWTLMERVTALERRLAHIETLEAPDVDLSPYVEIAGDTMTGALTLSGDPTAALHAVTRQYADRPLVNLVENGNFETWAGGTAVSPSRWGNSGSGSSRAQESTIVKQGTYSCKVTSGTVYCDIRQFVPFMSYYKGRTFTLGGWVYATAADRGRLSINDGIGTTTGDLHPGDSTWRWMTVTKTLDASATALRATGAIAAGSAVSVYFDGLILVEHPNIEIFAPHYGDLALLVGSYKNDSTVSEHRNLVLQYGITASSSGNKAVTFGTAYSVVFGAWPVGTGANWYYTASLTTTGCTFTRGGGASSDSVLWWALGIL